MQLYYPSMDRRPHGHMHERHLGFRLGFRCRLHAYDDYNGIGLYYHDDTFTNDVYFDVNCPLQIR